MVREGREADLLADLLVKTSRTFALSIPELPEPTRREVSVAYLLFRVADTFEDGVLWSVAERLEALSSLACWLDPARRSDLGGAIERWRSDPPLHDEGYLELLAALPAVLQALEDLPESARDIVRGHTARTIECMASFVRRSEELAGPGLRDLSDLQSYCYAVAGIVGEMLTELFLLDCPRLSSIAPELREHAAKFGEALQLVNILKDSAADAGEGRRFLPSAVESERVFELAREDLRRAGRYVLALQRAGAPRGIVAFTALPVLLAWSTLERVEQAGPGSRVTRAEVQRITRELAQALDHGRPPVPP